MRSRWRELCRDLRLAVLPACEAGGLCALLNAFLWRDVPEVWREREGGTLTRYALGVGTLWLAFTHWLYRTGRDATPALALGLISAGAGLATGACYALHAQTAKRRTQRRDAQRRQQDALERARDLAGGYVTLPSLYGPQIVTNPRRGLQA